MKRSLTIVLALLFSFNLHAVDSLSVLNTGGDELAFDHKEQYLDINILDLHPQPPTSPSFWSRILGKETYFGIIYAEFSSLGKTRKFPLLTYTSKSNNDYHVETVAIGNGIKFPLAKMLAYKPSEIPSITIGVRYWEDKKQAKLIKELIRASNLLSGSAMTNIDETLDLSTTLMSLLEKMWPSKDEHAKTSLLLSQDNIAFNKVTFGYKGSEFITLEFSAKPSIFSGKSLNSALNDYKPEQYDAWKGSIVDIDNNLQSSGLQALVNRLTEYSKYISSLPLNHADKVLLLAYSIENWSPNAVTGDVLDANGNKIHLSNAQYRRLDNSDWPLLDKLTNNVLGNLSGAGNCNTEQCKFMADFISKSSIGMDTSQYIPPRVSVIIDNVNHQLSREEFFDKFHILNDSGWSNFSPLRSTPKKWAAHFQPNQLNILFDGNEYKEHEIKVTMVQVREPPRYSHFVQSFEIIKGTATHLIVQRNPTLPSFSESLRVQIIEGD